MSDRLLLLACSQTKRPDAGLLPARERYNGPLWQTLRCVDPDAALCTAFALSARYGVVDARQGLPDYERAMTAERAAELAGNPLFVGRRDAAAPHLPCGFLQLERASGSPDSWFRDVCIVGGHLYLDVARRVVWEARLHGLLHPDAPVTIVNDQIGNMRQQLRAWLVQPIARRAA